MQPQEPWATVLMEYSSCITLDPGMRKQPSGTPVLPVFLLFFGCSMHPELRTASRFHPNGTKMETFSFYLSKSDRKGIPDTVLSGESISWDSSGTMVSSRFYRKGRLDGVSKDFFPDGRVRVRYFHRNGILDSTYSFDEKDRLRVRTLYAGERATIFYIDEFGNSSAGHSPVLED